MYLGCSAIPFGLFFGVGDKRTKGHRRLATFVWVFAMLTLWIPISAAVNWRGGWTLGPRFFGGATPFFGFGALCALEQISGRSRWRRAIMRGVAGGLLIASVPQLGFAGSSSTRFPKTSRDHSLKSQSHSRTTNSYLITLQSFWVGTRRRFGTSSSAASSQQR